MDTAETLHPRLDLSIAVTKTNVQFAILGAAFALLLFPGTGFRTSAAHEPANEEAQSSSLKLPVHMEAMSLSLYDADRFHYLLRRFCKERGYWIRYHGVMSLSEHRAAIQLELPVAACYWTVSFIDPKIRRSEVDSLPEFMIELVASKHVGKRIAWNLKLHESDLAIVPVHDSPKLGKETPIDERQTLDTFFSEFCQFAETRMTDYHYGVPFLPKDESAE